MTPDLTVALGLVGGIASISVLALLPRLVIAFIHLRQED